jgi:thioredoxin 1
MGTHTIDSTDAEFKAHVLDAATPVLVDFYATICPPCKALNPTLEALGEQFAGKLKIVKINCDDNIEAAQQYRIRATPTLLFFKGGKVVDQLVGAPPKSKLEASILKVL